MVGHICTVHILGTSGWLGLAPTGKLLIISRVTVDIHDEKAESLKENWGRYRYRTHLKNSLVTIRLSSARNEGMN
ncbi:hypothetical protein OH492_17120 [Vibrio chagasii]|nr:hypothetical protein [Vibrio chagasii]